MLTCLAAVVFAMSPSGSLGVEPVIPYEFYAVSFGTNYVDTEFELKGAEADATDFVRTIELLGYQGKTGTYVGSQATSKAFRDSLAVLAERASADSTVVIHFSGHGSQLPGDELGLFFHDFDFTGARRDNDGVIRTNDNRLVMGSTPEGFARISEMVKLVGRIPARNIVVVLDTLGDRGFANGVRKLVETGEAGPAFAAKNFLVVELEGMAYEANGTGILTSQVVSILKDRSLYRDSKSLVAFNRSEFASVKLPASVLTASALDYRIASVFRTEVPQTNLSFRLGYDFPLAGLSKPVPAAPDRGPSRGATPGGDETPEFERQGVDRAVIFAVQDYDTDRFDLGNPMVDAVRMKDVLDEFGFETEIVENPDLKTFEERLLSLRTPKQPYARDDQLLIMVSCHGFRDEKKLDGFLMLRDSDPKDWRTCYSFNFLRNNISGIPCRRVLLILDCCFSGMFDPSQEALSRDPVGAKARALAQEFPESCKLWLVSGRSEPVDDGIAGEGSPFANALIGELKAVLRDSNTTVGLSGALAASIRAASTQETYGLRTRPATGSIPRTDPQAQFLFVKADSPPTAASARKR